MNQRIPLLLYLLASLFGAGGQYLYKMGAKRLGEVPLYANWPLFAGVATFCAVMVLFVAGFRLGGRISVVYPAYALTFIWGAGLGIWIDHEPWSWVQCLGMGVIILGVVLVAVGAPPPH